MIQLNHFRLAAIFAVPSCFCAVPHAHAELPPSAYAQMKANASDVVEIEVTRVALNQREREGLRDISVYADAKIIAVTRSKSRLKIGDMISLRYITFEIIRPGWAGPGPIKTVQRGKRYRAWLKKAARISMQQPKGKAWKKDRKGRFSWSGFFVVLYLELVTTHSAQTSLIQIGIWRQIHNFNQNAAR